MSDDSFGNHLLVDAEATITFIFPQWNLLFAQSGTDAVYMAVDWGSHTLRGAVPGARIRLSGVGSYRGVVDNATFEVIGSAKLPASKFIEFGSDFSLDRHGSQHVTATIEVESATIGNGQGFLVGEQNGVKVKVLCVDIDSRKFFDLTRGEKISIAGVLGSWNTDEELEQGPIIYCATGENLHRLDHNENIIQDASSTIHEVLSAAKETPGKTYVVVGNITHIVPDSHYFLLGKASAIKVHTAATSGLKVGSLARVRGSFLSTDTGAEFHASVTNLKGASYLREAESVPATSVSKDKHSWKVIRLKGTITSLAQDDTWQMIVKDGKRSFKVAFSPPLDRWESLQLETAREVCVQGVCEFSSSGSEDFTIYPSGVENITVLERHLQFTLAHILTGVGIAACIIFLALLWIGSLRMKVEQRTRDLSVVNAGLRASYDAVPQALVVFDLGGEILESNELFRQFFGFQAVPGASITECKKAVLEVVDHSRRNEVSTWLDVQNRHAAARSTIEFAVLDDMEKTSFVGLSVPVLDEDKHVIARLWQFQDITENLQLLDTLVQSRKDEAVGRLASGIAHDFNNQLMVINANLAVARRSVSDPDSRLLESFEMAQLASKRAAEVVKQVLAYSSDQALDLKARNLNDIAQEIGRLLATTLDPSITFSIQLQKDLWYAKVDPAQLERVLMNICLNARDAIHPHAGTISITTSNRHLPEGSYVVVSVQDTGHGMSKEVRERIFEPFFTTKDQGKGTGLGLAMASGIIKQHKGYLECFSTPEEGTDFSIFLPRTERPSAQEIETDGDSEGSLHNGTRVLIVDDEKDLRQSIGEFLESTGCKVEAASNGEEALNTIELQDGRFDVVIMDLSMPVMSGQDAYAIIRRRWPKLPVVISSGHIVEFKTGPEQPNAVLLKPYRLAALLKTVTKVLPQPKG